jgi:hypothetical protein
MMFATIKQVTKRAASATYRPEKPRFASTNAYLSHYCGIRAAQARARSPRGPLSSMRYPPLAGQPWRMTDALDAPFRLALLLYYH